MAQLQRFLDPTTAGGPVPGLATTPPVQSTLMGTLTSPSSSVINTDQQDDPFSQLLARQGPRRQGF